MLMHITSTFKKYPQLIDQLSGEHLLRGDLNLIFVDLVDVIQKGFTFMKWP